MSSSGFMPGEWNNGQLGPYGTIDPQDLMRQRMAMTLMGNQGHQGQLGGMADAGNSILGALTMRDMQANAANKAYQGQPDSAFSSVDTGYGKVSSKLPALPNQSWLGSTGLGNLFSLGGGGQ